MEGTLAVTNNAIYKVPVEKKGGDSKEVTLLFGSGEPLTVPIELNRDGRGAELRITEGLREEIEAKLALITQ